MIPPTPARTAFRLEDALHKTERSPPTDRTTLNETTSLFTTPYSPWPAQSHPSGGTLESGPSPHGQNRDAIKTKKTKRT